MVDNFVEWTGQNHLRLNINMTREMVIDFRKKRKMAPQPLCILERDMEAVEDYKYLGVTINHRLDWRSNTEAVYKKGMSRPVALPGFNFKIRTETANTTNGKILF